MKHGCWIIIVAISSIIPFSISEEKHRKLTKRQSFGGPGQGFPLSRSRQYPSPEEIEDVSYDDPAPVNPPSYQFRGRQQPPEEYISEDYYTEAPITTTPAPSPTTKSTTTTTTTTTTTKAPNRIQTFNRFSGRPRFGSPSSTTPKSPTRAQSGVPSRVDVVSEIVNRPPPVRPVSIRTSSTAQRIANRADVDKKPDAVVPASRRSGTARSRPRGRFRTRSTTTTTTTTTASPEDYYYYYYDEEEDSKHPQQLATTTSTTTTTTTAKPPSLPRRPSLSRRPATPKPASTQRATVKFDLESQFQPPPEDAQAPATTQSSTKRFTTRTTPVPEPGAENIPYHLRGKYKPRTDGRFIDYYRDPNRPRELKGFDLADYPFYIRVPEDIDFECEGKKDGYYASIPHHCQLFHYCFAGQRYDFLCANYTLYDQTTFTCRFANNVDCPNSEKYFYRNDDLWKVITTPAPEEKKKRKVVKDDDEEEEDYSYDDEYYDEEEEDRRRRRPMRRRNRRRKNRRNNNNKSTTAAAATTTTS